MEPLIVLVVVTLGLLVAGRLGVRHLAGWTIAVRGGLAVMFVMTGMAHFVGMRAELVSMVPPGLGDPGLLVTVSGVLELAGAAGLLWARTAPWAAGGLAALLVAVFPANVHAVVAGVTSAPYDALVPRTAMQIVFLAATVAVLVHHLRARRLARPVGREVPAAPAVAARRG